MSAAALGLLGIGLVGSAPRFVKDGGVAVTELRLVELAEDARATTVDLQTFEHQHPEVFVDLIAEPATPTWPERLVAAFAAGNGPDLVNVAPDQVADYARAGWLRDLTGLPGEAALTRDELEFVRAQTHPFGRRYATVGGVAVRCFMYNREHFAKSEIAEVPSTMAELGQVASALQLAKADNYAFYWPVKNGAGVLAGDYVANGKDLFDPRLAATFLTDPRYVDVLQWHLAAFHVWKIADPLGFVSADTNESFPQGWTSFTWASLEQLREWQNPNRYRAGGKLVNSLCPSFVRGVHATIGTAQLYSVNRASASPDQAWLLARFLGGSDDTGHLTVPLRRWLDLGQGFGYRSLVGTPAARTAASGWCDVSSYFQQLARARAPSGVTAGWYAEWYADANIQSGLMLRRMISIPEYLQRLGARWSALADAWTQSGGLP